jgi:hypothetical protein
LVTKRVLVAATAAVLLAGCSQSGDTAAPAERTAAAAAPKTGNDTEQGLVRAGVYADRLTFDYGLLVRNAGDGGFHKRSVTDSLTVPVVAG